MSPFIRWILIFATTASLTLGSHVLALADQTWAGAGQIISGPGQGGSVTQLQVSVSDQRDQVTFQGGSPLKGKTIPLTNGVGQSGNLRYEFVWDNSELQVTLYTSDQVIVYRMQSGV